jgi:acylphosphatase
MTSVGADIRIRGMVQGVGYRHFCWRHATQMQLTGWTKNLPDGSVAVRVEGDRGQIEAFITDLKIGPSNASVSDLSVTWTPFTGQFQSFDITR